MSLRKIRQRAARSGTDGFTLIELLIVVVIIGILAAIAIPQFSNTKDQAQLAKMKSDLRNLVPSQEAYFVEEDTYASATADLTDYNSSSGVTVAIDNADATGWAATADHSAVDDTCVIRVGDATWPTAGPTEPTDYSDGAVVCG